MGKLFKKQTTVYVIAIAIIIVAFLLLGGGDWINGRMNHSNMNHWNWTQILISMAIGFVIGLLAAKRKWL